MEIEEWLGKDNIIGIDIWNKKYRYNNESFDDWLNRVSGGNELLKLLILDKKFLFAGRTLSNRGLNDGSYSNCYSSGFVLDNLKDIMQTNTNIALTYKAQGGQGLSLSKIRPKGAKINNRYESDGIIPFMEMYNKTTEIISQGGSRKGALLISLDITHKQAKEFITIKNNSDKINKANLSLEIDDEFMQYVEDSYNKNEELIMTVVKEYNGNKVIYDIIPIKLYKLMIFTAWKTAEPGVIFTERFRNYNLMEFVDKYQIETCNPCLHPDTVIETSEGKVKIKDIKKPMMVYSMNSNGELVLKKASPSWITKQNVETINIHMNNGQVLTCTPDHNIYIEGKCWIKAKDIKLGDSPIALLRRRRGIKYSGVRLSSQKVGSDVMEHRFIYEGHYGKIEDKYDIHHIDGDSYNNSIDNLECLTHFEHTSLTRFSCDNNHQIKDKTGRFISSRIKKLKTIIPLPKNLASNFKSKVRVIKISEGETTDVYDITVEDTHNFVADGIIVHNCGEQPLKKNLACNLGAINLSEYVINPFTKQSYFDFDTFKQDIAIYVEALDDIIDENRDNHALQEQKELSLAYRNIGLGVMGYADMLIKLGLYYGTINITEKIFKTLFREAIYASMNLARIKGTFPEYTKELFDATIIKNHFTEEEIKYLKTYGLRNCSLLSIAPTGSIGTMLNCSTGIEPNFALEFNRKTESLNGDKESYYKIEVDLVKQFKQINKTNILPDYFITSHNIDWKDRIYIQGLIQNFIDTAISSTVNLPNTTTPEEVELLYLEAWKKGLKGVTIYREGSRDGILTTNNYVKKTEESIKINTSQKRPKELKAHLYKVKAQGKQYIVIIGLLNDKPYEIFTFEASHSLYQEDEGIIIKIKKNQYKFKGKYQELNNIGILCTGKLEKSCTLYTSMLLRHNVDLDFIIKTSKKIDDNITSFVSAMNRILNKYNKNLKKDICPECGNILMNTGGCSQCVCGYSKCG